MELIFFARKAQLIKSNSVKRGKKKNKESFTIHPNLFMTFSRPFYRTQQLIITRPENASGVRHEVPGINYGIYRNYTSIFDKSFLHKVSLFLHGRVGYIFMIVFFIVIFNPKLNIITNLSCNNS